MDLRLSAFRTTDRSRTDSRWAAVAVLSIALLLAGLSAPADADSQGPKDPTSAVNDSSFGSLAWGFPERVYTSDDQSAGVSPLGSPTQYLKATSFGFSIPAPALIEGISVDVEKRSSSGTVFDARVRIVKGGVVGATDRAMGGTWPTTDTVFVYGGTSDLWGETWTAADINSSGFGVAISADDNIDTAAIDHISITVTYSLCPTSPRLDCLAAGKSILVVKDKSPDSKDKLIWKWIKGAATTRNDFEDPSSTAKYALCVYENGSLIASPGVPPGPPAWSLIGSKGFKYKDNLGTEDGIQKIILKSGTAGKAKALVKGKGDNLPTITPPLALPVRRPARQQRQREVLGLDLRHAGHQEEPGGAVQGQGAVVTRPHLA